MPYPETTDAFTITDQKNWSTFKRQEVKLKPFEDHDVDIAVDDVHTVTGGWGEVPLPLCVGHEVVGKVIKTGKNVKTFKVGDRVGVGAQIAADLTCNNCKNGKQSPIKLRTVDTYGSPYPDGTISQGGYSSHVRAHEYFTFPIPDNIPTELAAPMLCAGITVYSPLVRLGAGPGKHIAIVGVGGLGHFAVMFAAALGADVTVISHTPSKKDDALKLGAKNFIISGEKDWHKSHQFEFDFILNTADAYHKFDLPAYFTTMKIGGRFHTVGFGDHPLPSIDAQAFAPGQYYIGASHIGNRPEMLAMLKLVSEKNIKSWVTPIDISEAGCKEVVERVYKNDVRYRFTLTNYDKVFGKRT
ncbi:MAG: hypothetical protein Q9162_004255 [Coniocarpon cinnabarinum]